MALDCANLELLCFLPKGSYTLYIPLRLMREQQSGDPGRGAPLARVSLFRGGNSQRADHREISGMNLSFLKGSLGSTAQHLLQ